jgi:DNA invertase Pin-like site-specific DNA recombinase
MGSMLFTIMAALANIEHDVKRERTLDSISKRRDAGTDLGGRLQRDPASQIRSALRLVKSGGLQLKSSATSDGSRDVLKKISSTIRMAARDPAYSCMTFAPADTSYRL